MRRSPVRATPFALLALLALAAAACGPSAEKLEAARVLHAVEVVRAAPASADVEARLRLVDALEAAPATLPDALKAREFCARGFREMFQAEALLAEAEREAKKSAPMFSDIAILTAAAENKVAASRLAMATCDLATGALRTIAGR